MEVLKQRGNALYAQKKYDEAIKAYDEAIASLSVAAGSSSSSDEKEVHENVKEISKLRGTLLANRAACYLQTKRWEACILDASEALESDRQHVKALYRRAQAYEALGTFEKAFQDLRLAVNLDPNSQELVRAAHRLREATQQQESRRQSSPVAQLLARLRKGNFESTGTISRADAWKGLIGLTSEDGAAALDLLRQQGGGIRFVEACIHNTDLESERVLALRLLAASCQHGVFVKEAFTTSCDTDTAGNYFLQSLVNVLGEGSKVRTEKEERAEEEIASVLVLSFIRMVKEGKGHVQVLKPAIQCWVAALSHRQGTIQKLGLEALLWWSAECTTAKNPESASLLVGACLAPLVRLFEDARESSTFSMRLNATHLLGRIFGCLLGQEKGKERVKTLATELLMTTTTLKVLAERKLELRMLLVLALFNADASLGCWVLAEEETDAAVRRLLASGGADQQIVVAEVFNRASTTETGRACLRPYVLDHTLVCLMKTSGAPFEARVAAAAAFTKLGLAAKTLPSTSTELTDLLNIASSGLEQATACLSSPSPSFDGTRLRTSAIEGSVVEILSCLATRTTLKRELTFGSNRCKACIRLLLAFVQQHIDEGSRTSTITSTTSITKTTINSICSISSSSGAYDKVWYGVAFVLASLTLSNDELRKEALREKGIAPEEFEQLRKIQEMQQLQEGSEVDIIEAADPPEDVESRVKELVRLNAIRALSRLLSFKGLSPLAQEQAVTALVQIATVPEVRGRLILEGGYNACLSIAKKGAKSMETTRIKSLHALAKCLVTTNPKMLSDRQRLAPIAGLLWLCRHPMVTYLQQFESLLALTNLASHEEDCVEAILSNQGLKCLLSMQFSEHLLVRRAATEALCNMVYHPHVLASLRNPDTLKLWLALAEDYEGDLLTARAAAGGLAIASGDEEMASGIVEVPIMGLSVWRTLLSSGDSDLIHRAAVAIRSFARFKKTQQALVREGWLLSALEEASAGAGKPENLQQLMQAIIAEVGQLLK
ncbi:unc-45 family protein [Nannochloropsis oceanica]